MEKIEFKNNSEPYLSAENLNKIQENIEISINENKNEIENLKEKNIVTAYFTNYTSTGHLAPVTGLNVSVQVGDKLSLLNNGVKIGAGISKVLISGWGFNNSNSSGAGVIAGIAKNQITIESPFNTTSWQVTKQNNDNITMTITPMLVEVTEGDIVNICLGINGVTNKVFNRGAVTVETVE